MPLHTLAKHTKRSSQIPPQGSQDLLFPRSTCEVYVSGGPCLELYKRCGRSKIRGPENGLHWHMETWTKTRGPHAGGFILTHTQVISMSLRTRHSGCDPTKHGQITHVRHSSPRPEWPCEKKATLKKIPTLVASDTLSG